MDHICESCLNRHICKYKDFAECFKTTEIAGIPGAVYKFECKRYIPDFGSIWKNPLPLPKKTWRDKVKEKIFGCFKRKDDSQK